MATATKKRSTKTRQQTQGSSLTCPECGRSFKRPQGLGAHRRQAHGVIGTSPTATRRNAAATRRRGRPAITASKTSAAATTRTGAPRKATAGVRRPRAAGAARNGSGPRPGANRDALLQTLFPTGIPAREDVINAINSWLQEAERLVRMR